ncbi:MAG: hypothetical protein M5U26_19220 [Planctomycetota bacterium]|nr:hypothetical protein [Planctomycetota bacterium]
MWELVITAVLFVFVVGLVACFVWGLKLLAWIVQDPTRKPARVFPPIDFRPAPRALARDPEREAVLEWVQREVQRAQAAGALSDGAWRELQAYLNAERRKLRERGAAPAASTSRKEADDHPLSTEPTGALAPAAASAPVESPAKPREAEALRTRIAALHRHAEEAKEAAARSPAEWTGQEIAPAEFEALAQDEPPAEPAARVEVFPLAAPPAKPLPVPVEPPMVAPPPPEPVRATERGEERRHWTERLFTPENVRILQSLGIAIIFFSAVAYVRTSMWDAASADSRMSLLFAGTLGCMGLGFALRRWTSLRITGLAFMLLGHLALALDAYAALAAGSPGVAPLWPYSGAALWSLTLLLFAGSSCWHGARLDEPLFRAFGVFGGLGAWAMALCWAGLDGWLMPAGMAPAALACAGLGRGLRGPEAFAPRWSYSWWLASLWHEGAWLLSLALPLAALGSGRAELHANLYWHLLGMTALAACLFWPRERVVRGQDQSACWLALAAPPLAAYAHAWAAGAYAPVLACSGAALASAGLYRGGSRVKPNARIVPLLSWGALAAALGVALAVCDRAAFFPFTRGGFLSFGFPVSRTPVPALLAALASLGLATVWVWRERDAWAVWAAMGLAAFATVLTCGLHSIGASAWAPAWFILAGCAQAFLARTEFMRREGEVQAALRGSADTLALAALLHACAAAPIPLWPSAVMGATWTTALAWSLAAGYGFLTAWSSGQVWRGQLGLALLSPALVASAYALGFEFAAPAPALALLAALVVGASYLPALASETALKPNGARWGAALILAHGLGLALYQAAHGGCGEAAIACAVLGLSAGVLAWSVRREAAPWLAVVAEFAAVGLLLGAGFLALRAHFEWYVWKPEVWILLSALSLALALVGESLAPRPAYAPAAYRLAGSGWAVTLTSFALVVLAFNLFNLTDVAACVAAIEGGWLAALVPLHLALRVRWSKQAPETHSLKTGLPLLAGGLAGAGASLSAAAALMTAYWQPACAAEVRHAAVLFADLLTGAAILLGWRARTALAPALGAVGMLGLLGGAYGGWTWPSESFGFALAALSAGLRLGRRLSFSRESGAQSKELAAGYSFASACLGLLATPFLMHGLTAWPLGGTEHAWGLAAWMLLAATCWRASYEVRPHKPLAALAALAFGAALAHGLRWWGVAFPQFGPLLGAWALALLAAHASLAARERAGDKASGRAAGLLATVALTGIVALILAGWGALRGETWRLSLTLLEAGIGCAGFALLCRLGEKTGFARMVGLEVAAWMAWAGALSAAGHAAELWFWPGGLPWMLAAAAVLPLGMAAEACCGAALGAERQQRPPTPFLESRHLAACLIGLWSLVHVLFRAHPFAAPHLETTWRVLMGLGLLSVYGSFAVWSLEARFNSALRVLASYTAYVVLLPGAYLAHLAAHSTGSGWGGPIFLALCPALMVAALMHEREQRRGPATAAWVGAASVALAAVVLSFVANPARDPAVLCVTCLGLSALAYWARRFAGARELSLVASALLSAATFYFTREAAGLPAWGVEDPSAWEPLVLALLGWSWFALGHWRLWEPGADGRSLIARFGLGLNFFALAWSLLAAALHGAGSGGFGRIDALSACLLVSAGACWHAKHALRDGALGVCAPLLGLCAYGILAWRQHAEAWEWYTLPAALLALEWSRRLAQAEDAGRKASPANPALFAGCVLATLPSFLQAVPYGNAALPHFFMLLGLGLALVMGAMWTRRKIPLLVGSSAMLLLTLVKALQWAAHRDVVLPVVGVAIGFAVLAVGCLFESRMNRAIREAVDRARAEARMFWVSWR